jgi:hypothetical protein
MIVGGERGYSMTFLKLTARCSILLSLLGVLIVDSSSCRVSAQTQVDAQQQGGGAVPKTGLRRNRARVRQPANPLGPAFVKGQDNAQNPNRLKSGMKVQERRQRHQYQQAMSQVKEQQQQEYEKEMLQTLGSQRPVIKQSRKEISKVRQATGANE